jgi:hypothetical protein
MTHLKATEAPATSSATSRHRGFKNLILYLNGKRSAKARIPNASRKTTRQTTKRTLSYEKGLPKDLPRQNSPTRQEECRLGSRASTAHPDPRWRGPRLPGKGRINRHYPNKTPHSKSKGREILAWVQAKLDPINPEGGEVGARVTRVGTLMRRPA